jgi:plastocyanin
VAEGTGLLNRHRAKSPVAGSNPALSATPSLLGGSRARGDPQWYLSIDFRGDPQPRTCLAGVLPSTIRSYPSMKMLSPAAFFLPCLILALSACTSSTTQTVTIVAQDFRFVPAEVRVNEDRPFRLTIRNEGREAHVFASPLLGLGGERATAIEIQPGKTVQVEMRAPAGTYAFRCARRGHGGMEGLMIVESAP